MSELNENFLFNRPGSTTMRVLEFANIYSVQEHIPNEHELLYVLDGKVKLHFGSKLTFHANQGDFLLVPEKMPHRDEFAPLKGLRILIMQFHWDCGDYFRIVNNRTLMDLSYEVRSEARRRLEFLRTRWNGSELDRTNAAIQLHSILLLFYTDLLNTAAEKPSGAISIAEAMNRAKHFVDQNFAEPITLKQTAEHINISPAYLSRMFHYEYGVSFNKYLNAIRLAAARELLLKTSCQTAEVAARCGFSTSSYFIKVFKEYYGVTPKNYARCNNRSDHDRYVKVPLL